MGKIKSNPDPSLRSIFSSTHIQGPNSFYGFLFLSALLNFTAAADVSTSSNDTTVTLDSELEAQKKIELVQIDITIPSREIRIDMLEKYILSLSSSFTSKSREFDPFGQPQDPSIKPTIKAPSAAISKKLASIIAVPFSDIIEKISITTVMPGEKRFLVGTKSYKEGDKIPLIFRGQRLNVQITQVSSKQLTFKNLDNEQVSIRKLKMLPMGMSHGNQGVMVPGMTLDSPNAPIEIEMGE